MVFPVIQVFPVNLGTPEVGLSIHKPLVRVSVAHRGESDLVSLWKSLSEGLYCLRGYDGRCKVQISGYFCVDPFVIIVFRGSKPRA